MLWRMTEHGSSANRWILKRIPGTVKVKAPDGWNLIEGNGHVSILGKGRCLARQEDRWTIAEIVGKYSTGKTFLGPPRPAVPADLQGTPLDPDWEHREHAAAFLAAYAPASALARLLA